MNQRNSLDSTHEIRVRRHAVALQASIKRASGRTCPCVVRDLSLDGCCVTGFFHIDEQIEIRIQPIGIFRAQVRWAFMGRAGVKFFRNKPSAVPSRSLVGDTAGVAAIEYALLLALIALAIVVSLRNAGEGVRNNWNEVNSAVTGASGVDYNSG